METKHALNWAKVCDVASRRAWTGGPLDREDLVQSGVLGALEGEFIPDKAKGAYERMRDDIERLYDEPLMAPLEHARYDPNASDGFWLGADEDADPQYIRDMLDGSYDSLSQRISEAYDDPKIANQAVAASMGSTYAWMTDDDNGDVIDAIQADEQHVERPWDRPESSEYVDECVQYLFRTGDIWDISKVSPEDVDASWLRFVSPPIPCTLDAGTDKKLHHNLSQRWWLRDYPSSIEFDGVEYKPSAFDVSMLAQGKAHLRDIRFNYLTAARPLNERELARLTLSVARIVSAGARTQGKSNADEYRLAVIDSVLESLGPDGTIDDEVWDRVDPDWPDDADRYKLDVQGSVRDVQALVRHIKQDLREPTDVSYDMVTQTYKGWQEWDTKEGLRAAIKAMFIEFTSPNGVHFRAKQAFWSQRSNARTTMAENNNALKSIGLMRVKAFKYNVVPRESIPVKSLLRKSKKVRDVWGWLHDLVPGTVLSVQQDKADLLDLELRNMGLEEDVAVFRAS